MDTKHHILNLLKALLGDPAARLRVLAVASAATMVVAILRDACTARVEAGQRAPARVARPRERMLRRPSR